MENKRIELSEIKWILAPITFDLIWLSIWTYGYMLGWKINYPIHIILGLTLIIITMWACFTLKLNCNIMMTGLNLFSFAVFLLMLHELHMPLIPNCINIELYGMLMITAFIIMTLGVKQVVGNNLSLLQILTHNANTDALTKLMNRRAISEKLEKMIEEANREGGQIGVYMLDFDNFKYINDAYGHEFGDQVLINIANKVDMICCDDLVCGRLGGDEFLVIQKNVSNRDDAIEVSKRILQCFNEIQDVDGSAVHMSTSIGISFYPEDGTSKSELIRKADMALYNVKNTYKNGYELYTSNLELSNNIHDIKIDIINGLQNNEFEVYFQPIVKLSDMKIISFEALVRWHRSEGVVSPASFIPVAEKYGLIMEMDLYVLRRVCENYKSFRNYGYSNVSINLSAKTIIKPDLIEKVRKSIEEFEISPGFLTFEITETAIIKNECKTFENVSGLRELGCKISLDDFGTGYSSLNHLRNLLVNALKIDKSFIDGIGNNPHDESVVKGVLTIANDLGIETIAEGVEQKEQVEFLAACKCDKVQGYYYGKPMKLEDVLILNVEVSTAL